MIRDVGDLVSLSTVLRDSAGAVNNAATGVLTITKPDGTTTLPAVTNTGANGIYTASVTADQAGLWAYVWTFSGAVVTVEPDQFTVRATGRALVASMEEIKSHLGRSTGNIDDSALRSVAVSATDWLEWRIGGPLSVQTFTERVGVSGWWIIPSKRPLVDVTSLTPELGSALDSTAWVVDTIRNAIRLRWGALSGWYTLVYRAGLAAGPNERQKFAGLELIRHLWLVRNGTSGRGFPGDDVQTPLGFAVPRRVDELLSAGDSIPGIA